MGNGILSQEEIDALLRGEPASLTKESDLDDNYSQLTDMEIDAIGEIGNICMGTAATTLSTLLGKRVSITTPQVVQTTRRRLLSEYMAPYLIVTVQYTEGLKGANLLIVKTEDAAVIADLMMGRDGLNPSLELDDILLSAVSEAMNQMMGSATTSMATMYNKRIDISPPLLNVVQLAESQLNNDSDNDLEDLLQISFRMIIDDLVDSQIMQIIPMIYAKDMVSSFFATMEASSATVSSPQSFTKTTSSTPVASVFPTEAVSKKPASSKKDALVQAVHPVQPVQFAPLTPVLGTKEMANIGLVMDVPLEVSVELGRTRKTIKEILELGPGSIIQLDKLAGEPVDLLVNGKLVAKGEVVVIDESFGIRVTNIVTPVERISNLQ
jgi:flagellar motor switch protein FliN/FliY